MLDRAAPVTTIVEAAVCGVPGPPLYQHRLWLLLIALYGCDAASCVLLLGLCNLKALLCVGEASANEAAELL
jgi:hypothetical protein